MSAAARIAALLRYAVSRVLPPSLLPVHGKDVHDIWSEQVIPVEGMRLASNSGSGQTRPKLALPDLVRS